MNSTMSYDSVKIHLINRWPLLPPSGRWLSHQWPTGGAKCILAYAYQTTASSDTAYHACLIIKARQHFSADLSSFFLKSVKKSEGISPLIWDNYSIKKSTAYLNDIGTGVLVHYLD